MGVLGSMLLDPDRAIPRATSRISEQHFYQPANQIVFDVLRRMHKARVAVDLLTVCDQLSKRKDLEAIGGRPYVTSLITFIPVPVESMLDYYLAFLIEAFQRRTIIRGCAEAQGKAYDLSQDIPLIKKRVFSTMREAESRSNESATRATVAELGQMIDARQIGAHLGIDTGISGWDTGLRGIFPKRFYVLGARPKIGKTAMIEQMAQTQIRNGIPVLIFERDMSLTDLIGRMACRTAGVVFQAFITGVCTNEELQNVRHAAEAIDPDLLRLHSPTNMTADELCSIVEREIQEYGIQVWYLDLFQRLKTPEKDRVESLVDAANAIRDVIQSTGVPGVILAEILRDAEKTKRPNSSQFKYCDGLFSSCDTSILLWSNEDPKTLIEPDGKLRRQKVNFTIDANRGGAVGDETIYFDRPLMTFHGSEGELF